MVSQARSQCKTMLGNKALVLSVRRHHARVTHQIMLLVLSSAGARGAKGSNKLIKETLSAIGIDSKGFSTHRLRAGGATFIAKNLPRSDGSDRLLTLHGRWRSEQAKNMYVKEPLESRLQLTRFFPSF